MKESSFWVTMRNGVSKVRGLHIQRIENSAAVGTPDVELCLMGRSAWIELKHIKEIPKRPTTKIRIEHFTDDQKLWLRQRGLAGGRAWLFCQVMGFGYLLFDWKNSQEVGHLTLTEMQQHATVYWEGNCDWIKLLEAVCTK